MSDMRKRMRQMFSGVLLQVVDYMVEHRRACNKCLECNGGDDREYQLGRLDAIALMLKLAKRYGYVMEFYSAVCKEAGREVVLKNNPYREGRMAEFMMVRDYIDSLNENKWCPDCLLD